MSSVNNNSCPANIFKVTRASSVPSKSRRLVPDRRDLNMRTQRRVAENSRRESLQAALMKDYNSSICSRVSHTVFLKCILAEVQHYHRSSCGHSIPTDALRHIADQLDSQMLKTDRDHYADCLGQLGKQHVYSTEFREVAEQLAARYRESKEDPANSSYSSQGLSDNGEESME